MTVIGVPISQQSDGSTQDDVWTIRNRRMKRIRVQAIDSRSTNSPHVIHKRMRRNRGISCSLENKILSTLLYVSDETGRKSLY